MNTIIAEGPRVIHALPGRIRVRLPGWSGRGHQRIEERLRRVRGVGSARANPLTGTVLIRFDPGASTESALLAALGDLQPEPPTNRAFGKGLAAVHHLVDLAAVLSGPKGWGMLADALRLMQGLPWVRNSLGRILGPTLAQAVLHVGEAVVSACVGSPLGVIVAALEVLLRLGDLLTPLPRIAPARFAAAAPAAA